MKNFFAVLIILVFNSNIANAIEVKANCMSGHCWFSLNIFYDWAETRCMDNLQNETVDLNIARFTIVKTGKSCFITRGQ